MSIKDPELTIEQKQAVLNALVTRALSGDTIAAVHLSKTFLKTEKVQLEVGRLLPQYTREQLLDLWRDYEATEATVIQLDPPVSFEQTNNQHNNQHLAGPENSFRSEGIRLCETPHPKPTPAGRRTPVPPETPFSRITVGPESAPVTQSCFERDQNIIKDAQTKLLTSNSREEIDALCSRIALAQSRSNTITATNVAPITSETLLEPLKGLQKPDDRQGQNTEKD